MIYYLLVVPGCHPILGQKPNQRHYRTICCDETERQLTDAHNYEKQVAVLSSDSLRHDCPSLSSEDAIEQPAMSRFEAVCSLRMVDVSNSLSILTCDCFQLRVSSSLGGWSNSLFPRVQEGTLSSTYHWFCLREWFHASFSLKTQQALPYILNWIF